MGGGRIFLNRNKPEYLKAGREIGFSYLHVIMLNINYMENKKTIRNVYIDGANLKQGILLENKDVDYVELYKWLKKKYKVSEVYIFLGYIPKLKGYYEELEIIGYKVIFKETFFEDKILKANCDAELILNCVCDFYKKSFDEAIVVSGDGDFSCLVKFLESESALHRLISPNVKRCSIFLKRSTNKIVYLNSVNDVLKSVTRHSVSLNEKAPDEGAPVSGSSS